MVPTRLTQWSGAEMHDNGCALHCYGGPKWVCFYTNFNVRKHSQDNYFVIGSPHSPKAWRQLVREHPITYFFKYAECKIYVGLTTEEAKLLAWDHNNDNEYRQKMSSIMNIWTLKTGPLVRNWTQCSGVNVSWGWHSHGWQCKVWWSKEIWILIPICV